MVTYPLMILHYFKVGIRNMLKHKMFSLINLLGLAVAMSVCMLIIMMIADQKSYDDFHKAKDRIYRIETTGTSTNEFNTASSALPLAATLRETYPGIDASVALVKNIGGDIFYNERIASGGGYFTDKHLFEVFDFELLHGDPLTALEKPFSLVISEALADQLFYKEDPIGKVVRFNDTGINPGGPETGNKETLYGNFIITGVLAANPGKTTLPFKILASLSTLDQLTKDSILNYPPDDWNNVWSNYTYVQLAKNKSPAELQQVLNNISKKKSNQPNGNGYAFRATLLSSLMPADPISNQTNIGLPRIVLIILSVLCLIVMLSACLNYTNLSLARQLTRAKEVGIRKVSGAGRRDIFIQFVAESVLVSLGALVLSSIILFFLQRLFSGLWLNQYLNITFRFTPTLALIFIAFSIAVGALAGLLPAIYISLFDPARILKGLNTFTAFKRLTLRKVLLVAQSCVSLIFIISTSVLLLQSRHILHFKYGFDKDNIVNIKLFKTENYDRFAHALQTNKNIVAVGACSFPPATGNNNSMIVLTASEQDSVRTNFLDIDAGSAAVWNLKWVAGKNFPSIPVNKDDRYIVVNEKLVNDLKLGSPQQAVGQHLLLGKLDVEIAGVVKNFQFLDVTRQMEPLMLRNRKTEFGYVTVKVEATDVASTLASLQATWKEVNPASKFEYEFFDQQLRITHAMMSDTAGILSVLSILAVLISCLGLLGMATYTVETRKKEIGVRKVLGSSVMQVLVLLSRSFVSLLAIAIVVSVPVAIIINNLWLRSFPSRVTMSPLLLFADCLMIVLISLMIVLSQVWGVSRLNPVNSLRSE